MPVALPATATRVRHAQLQAEIGCTKRWLAKLDDLLSKGLDDEQCALARPISLQNMSVIARYEDDCSSLSPPSAEALATSATGLRSLCGVLKVYVQKHSIHDPGLRIVVGGMS